MRNQVEGAADGNRFCCTMTVRKSVAAWKSVLRRTATLAEAARSLRFAVLMLPQGLDALMSGKGRRGGGVRKRKQPEMEAEGAPRAIARMGRGEVPQGMRLRN